MRDHPTHIVEAAKKFMLAYFSDGKEKAPIDFDNDIIGGDSTWMIRGPRWDDTPFVNAMADLVESGQVIFRTDEEGQHFYKLAIS